ncbi:MAG: ABC transporter permease subunit, partial [Candidatus Methanosuratincola sp.]
MLSREEYLKLPLEERFIKLDPEGRERAERLFNELVTVDLHTHMFGSIHFSFDYELVRQSGITCCFEAVPALSEDFEESMELLGRYQSIVDRHPGLASATRAEEMAQDRETATLVGIDIRKVIFFVFALGPGLGGLAGLMNGLYYRAISFNMGWSYGLKAF